MPYHGSLWKEHLLGPKKGSDSRRVRKECDVERRFALEDRLERGGCKEGPSLVEKSVIPLFFSSLISAKSVYFFPLPPKFIVVVHNGLFNSAWTG